MKLIRPVTFPEIFAKSLFIGVLLSFVFPSESAGQCLTMDQVVQKALENHPAVRSSGSLVRKAVELRKTSFDPGRLDVEFERGRSVPDGAFSLKQTFSFPTVYAAQSQLNKQQVRLAEDHNELTVAGLKRDVMLRYNDAQYLKALVTEYEDQDSLYAGFAMASARQFQAGQIDYLQKVYAEAQALEVHNLSIKHRTGYLSALEQLNTLINDHGISVTDLQPLSMAGDTSSANHPAVKFYGEAEELQRLRVRVERARSLPDVFLGFRSSDTNWGAGSVQLGVAIPLWAGQHRGAIGAARYEAEAARFDLQNQQMDARMEIQAAWGEVAAHRSLVDYYQTSGMHQAEKIIDTSYRLLKSGQSDYISFIRNLSDAFEIRLRRIETLKDYNTKLINLQYLTGKL